MSLALTRRLRRWLRGLEPRVLDMLKGPLLDRTKPWLDRRDVLNFARRPLALGVAVGMFCGLIPGPLQVAGTLALCAWWRGNMVAGVVATFYTNPLTIAPLYALAFQVGAMVLPGHQVMPALPPLDFGSLDWMAGLAGWVGALGWPLLVGLPLLGLALALGSYALVQGLWLLPVLRRARLMRQARATRRQDYLA